jgi:hypothetical protein
MALFPLRFPASFGSHPAFSLGDIIARPINYDCGMCGVLNLRFFVVSSLRSSLVVVLATALAVTTCHAATHRKSSSAAHNAASKPATHSGSHTATSTHSKGSGRHSASATVTETDTASSGKKRHGKKAAVQTSRSHGQQAIQPERVTAIQQALIREHYLNKEADGSWDSETEAAMQKYQADQGWQTKLMPDARALKKLGLGPDYSNAINARTGNFGDPTTPGTTSGEQTGGFAAAAGVSR